MSNIFSGGSPLAADPLTRAVLDIDDFASTLGWDQPARLFALLDTARLRAEEPELSRRLGLGKEGDGEGSGAAGSLTPVEQDEIPADASLDEFLATIAWPDVVVGCALTVERLMLPPSAEESMPTALDETEAGNPADEAALAKWAAAHPERQEVRMTVGVLRDGRHQAAIRLREKDSPTEVLTGSSLVPGLAEALSATFEE